MGSLQEPMTPLKRLQSDVDSKTEKQTESSTHRSCTDDDVRDAEDFLSWKSA